MSKSMKKPVEAARSVAEYHALMAKSATGATHEIHYEIGKAFEYFADILEAPSHD